MKFESLFLFILGVILFYLTLRIVIKFLNIKIPEGLIFAGAFLFLFHPDSLLLNIWISNRTELLSLIFYLLSIYSFFLFFLKEQKKFLIISFISFLLGVLSKQQGIHLPLLLLVFYSVFLKNRIDCNKRILTTYFLFSFILMIVITSVNVLSENETIALALDNYWKKPFSFVGISIYSLIIFVFLVYFYFSFYILIYQSVSPIK